MAMPVGEKRIAAFPACRTQMAIQAFEDVFRFHAARNIFEGMLNSPNLVIHVAGTLLNTTAIEKMGQDFALYTNGLTPSLLRCADAVEKERNQVLRLSDQEAERLGKGEVIQKAVEVNGEKTLQYLQLDPETKSVIHRRVTDVQLEQKLKDMEKVNDIELGMQQKQQVREGKPIELNVGGEKVSVGVDLKEPQGFKVIQGDMKEWERQQKLRYDEQHPEFLGLVMTDKNRWEYQQVVDKQSQERALKLHAPKTEKSQGLKF